MSTRVSVSNEVIQSFKEFRMGKKHKYMILRLDDKYENLEIEKMVEKRDVQSYEDFVAEIKKIQKESCRYLLYHLDWETSDNAKRSKTCYFLWCPETAKLKSKLVYAACNEYIKKTLDIVAVEIQATDLSEVDYEYVLERASRGKRDS